MDKLKQQASELYRERTDRESIPTSDSLAMGKLVWIAVGLVIVAVVGIQIAGGFRSQPNPVIAANTPPPLKKEAPPPGMLDPLPAPGNAASSPSPAAAPAPPASPPPVPAPPQPAPAPVFSSSPAPRPAPAAADRRDRPQLTRDVPAAPRPKPEQVPATRPAPVAAPVETAEPSPAERSRQETAREIVIEKSPPLAKLITSPEEDITYKGWKAQPDGSDSYQVTFTFLDRSSGAPIQYVWKVNVASRSIVPLSYYSRRLS